MIKILIENENIDDENKRAVIRSLGAPGKNQALFIY